MVCTADVSSTYVCNFRISPNPRERFLTFTYFKFYKHNQNSYVKEFFYRMLCAHEPELTYVTYSLYLKLNSQIKEVVDSSQINLPIPSRVWLKLN